MLKKCSAILWLQLQNNFESTYHTKLRKDIRYTKAKTISFSNYQIVVPCEAIKRKKAFRRETYNVVEIYLVC